jgi:hypothetical protein
MLANMAMTSANPAISRTNCLPTNTARLPVLRGASQSRVATHSATLAGDAHVKSTIPAPGCDRLHARVLAKCLAPVVTAREMLGY